MGKVRFMSQNQWSCTQNNETWEKLGLDCSAKVRMKGHTQVLADLLPDIMGGQEVNAEMLRFLKFYSMDAGLDYTVIWGNGTPILYRADKFDLLDSEYLSYPEHVEGYEGCFNNSLSKSCLLGVFRDKSDGKVFIFATTHLWWKNGTNPSLSWYQRGSDEVRVMQIQLADEMIRKYQAKYDNCPIIFVGDMNASYRAPAIRWALDEGGYSHAHDVATDFADETSGYNGCGPNAPGKWREGGFETAIDHILVKDISEGAVKRFERYSPDFYLYLSDHSAIIADIEL